MFRQRVLLRPSNSRANTYGWKSFHLRGSIPKIMDGLTLEWEIVGVSSVSMRPTSDGKVNIEHFISENTHKSNALRFLMNIWCLSHFMCFSWPNMVAPFLTQQWYPSLVQQGFLVSKALSFNLEALVSLVLLTLLDSPTVVLESWSDFVGEQDMDPVLDCVIGYGDAHLWKRVLGASVSD